MRRKTIKLPDTFYQELEAAYVEVCNATDIVREARAFALKRDDAQMAGMLRKIQYLLQNVTKKGNDGTVGY